MRLLSTVISLKTHDEQYRIHHLCIVVVKGSRQEKSSSVLIYAQPSVVHVHAQCGLQYEIMCFWSVTVLQTLCFQCTEALHYV